MAIALERLSVYILKFWGLLNQRRSYHRPVVSRLRIMAVESRQGNSGIVRLARNWVSSLPTILIFLAIVGLCGGISFLPPVVSALLAVALLIINLMIFPVIPGTICGTIIAINVSNALANERVKGRFEQIQVTTLGELGLMVFLMRIIYWQSSMVRSVRQLAAGIYVIILVLTTFLFVVVMFSTPFAPSMLTFLGLYLLVAVAYYDLIASLVIGVIIGLLISTYTQHSINAVTVCVGAVVGLQLLATLYIVIVLILIGRGLGSDVLLGGGVVLSVAVVSLREGVFAFLLKWLRRRLDVSAVAFNQQMAIF